MKLKSKICSYQRNDIPVEPRQSKYLKAVWSKIIYIKKHNPGGILKYFSNKERKTYFRNVWLNDVSRCHKICKLTVGRMKSVVD